MSFYKQYRLKECPEVRIKVNEQDGKYGTFFKANIYLEGLRIGEYTASKLDMVKLKGRKWGEYLGTTIMTAYTAYQRGDKGALIELQKRLYGFDVNVLIKDEIKPPSKKVVKSKKLSGGRATDWKQ